MSGWIVTWMRKPIAQPFLIDVNSIEMAAEISIRLADTPLVYDVKVTDCPYEEDPELKERIWARVKARMGEYPVLQV